MNMIKFVSVALCGMCMPFLIRKKGTSSVNNTPAIVEIFVCNLKGKPLVNKVVVLYDENRYENFQKDHTVKSSLKRIASSILENQPWFVKNSFVELMCLWYRTHKTLQIIHGGVERVR